MSLNVEIAVGVGCNFAIVSPDDIRGIKLKSTETQVEVNNKIYPLYKGETFEESQKIDALFDKGSVKEYPIDEYKVCKRKFVVLVSQTGTLEIEAQNESEAIRQLNEFTHEDVEWGNNISLVEVFKKKAN